MVAKKSNKEHLTPVQRAFEFVPVVGVPILMCFFIYHQVEDTGFFTDKFGTLEMACFYVPMLLAMLPPLARIYTGVRNPARPLDALSNVSLAIGSLILLLVFPFNYAHLADPLPDSLESILSWITDDIAKIFLILQVVIASVNAVIHLWKYISFQQDEPASSAFQQVS